MKLFKFCPIINTDLYRDRGFLRGGKVNLHFLKDHNAVVSGHRHGTLAKGDEMMFVIRTAHLIVLPFSWEPFEESRPGYAEMLVRTSGGGIWTAEEIEEVRKEWSHLGDKPFESGVVFPRRGYGFYRAVVLQAAKDAAEAATIKNAITAPQTVVSKHHRHKPAEVVETQSDRMSEGRKQTETMYDEYQTTTRRGTNVQVTEVSFREIIDEPNGNRLYGNWRDWAAQTSYLGVLQLVETAKINKALREHDTRKVDPVLNSMIAVGERHIGFLRKTPSVQKMIERTNDKPPVPGPEEQKRRDDEEWRAEAAMRLKGGDKPLPKFVADNLIPLAFPVAVAPDPAEKIAEVRRQIQGEAEAHMRLTGSRHPREYHQGGLRVLDMIDKKLA